jgi:hypothetical protein
MRPVIAIDVALLAVPNYAATSKDVEAIIRCLNSWARAAETQNCCVFVMVSGAIGTLQAANCFPATHNIQALLELFGLENVFSARDINSRVFSFINRASRLVDVFGFEVFGCENSAAPEVDTSSSPSALLVDNLHCILATACMAGRSELIRFVSGFPISATPVNFSGDVVRIKGQEGESDVVPPSAVAGSIHVVSAPSEFLKTLDAKAVWDCAEDEIQYHMAISLEIARMAPGNPQSLPLELGAVFCIGAQFVASLQQHQAAGDGKYGDVVRSKCAQVVWGTSGIDIKDFGEIRLSDNADSFRVHITKHHEALRLMFWKKSGLIELANVGVKSELMILSGDQQVRFSSKFQGS